MFSAISEMMSVRSDKKSMTPPPLWEWYAIPANRELIKLNEYALIDSDGVIVDTSAQLYDLLIRHQGVSHDYLFYIVRREEHGLVLLRDFILMDNHLGWHKWMGTDPASEMLESARVGDALYGMLERVAKKKKGAAYISAKKITQNISGTSIGDIGQIGIAEKFVENLMFPGDLVIYSSPLDLRPRDVVSVVFPGLNEDEIELKHFMVVESEVDGAVTLAQMKVGGRQFKCPKKNLIGKLVSVIPFDSPEWKDLTSKLVKKEAILSVLQTATKSKDSIESEEGQSIKTKVLKELETRIQSISQ